MYSKENINFYSISWFSCTIVYNSKFGLPYPHLTQIVATFNYIWLPRCFTLPVLLSYV